MRKKILILSMLVAILEITAQQGRVGVNTDTPKATLEIKVSPTNITGVTTEGVLIPRVDRARVQAMVSVEESTLVYVNDVTTGTATGTAVDMLTKGFYYFDQGVNKWVKLLEPTTTMTNIYDGDGALTSNREVSLNGNNLTFTGSGNIGIGTNTPESWAKLHTKGYIYAENGHLVSSMSSNEGGSLSLRNPSKANSEASEWRIWNMIGGGYGHNSLQFWKYSKDASKNGMAMTLSDNGNVGIGYHMPAVKLHIMGTGDHKLRLQHQGSADFTDIVKRSNGTFNIYNNVGGGSWVHGLSVSNAGNVGLGTETPGQKLHIEGNSYMNGWLHTTGGARISGVSGQHSGADLWVDGHTDTNTLNVRGTSYVKDFTINNIIINNGGQISLPRIYAPCNAANVGAILFRTNILGAYNNPVVGLGELNICVRSSATGYGWSAI